MYRKLPSEAARLEQEELDIRCLQLLRATIHNEERKLPEDWEENAADNKKYSTFSRGAGWRTVTTIRYLGANRLHNFYGSSLPPLPSFPRPTLSIPLLFLYDTIR